MKMMLSKSQKLRKTQTARARDASRDVHVMHHVHHNSRARGTGTFLQTSPPLTRNMIAKVAVELYCIFSKISKF